MRENSRVVEFLFDHSKCDSIKFNYLFLNVQVQTLMWKNPQATMDLKKKFGQDWTMLVITIAVKIQSNCQIV